MSSDPANVAPDRVMVIETIGPVARFADAARGLGFEWLADQLADGGDDIDVEAEADEAEVGDHRIYLTLPTAPALASMLARWRRFKGGEPRPGKAVSELDGLWWDLFGYLEDVRSWSAQDRVDPRLSDYVRRERELNPEQPVLVELDLWFRASIADREMAEAEVRASILSSGGTVLDRALIEEIEYHALMVELPAHRAAELGDRTGILAKAQALMTVRPQSVIRRSTPPEAPLAAGGGSSLPTPGGTAIAALLDGYPVASHTLLRGRVNVEEIDVDAAAAPASARYHGTSMASLIVHGDLHAKEPALSSLLVVVPILAANQDGEETTPRGKLPLAMVYRAVVALVEGLDGSEPLAPELAIVNHSLGDAEGPFVRRPSAWARLLDYLSHRYDLLFVVSAGNVEAPFGVPTYATRADAVAADGIALQAALLNAIEGSKGTRGLLSPAESLHSLTVGAVHEDLATGAPPAQHDPFPAFGMTNVCSALGFGVNRSVKPDLVEAGGRQFVTIGENAAGVFAFVNDTGLLGQSAASPDPHGGSLRATRLSTGTSNAAALTTRAAVRAAEIVRDSLLGAGEDWSEGGRRAVILKAMLVHGAGWGRAGEVLDGSFPPEGSTQWNRRRQGISRFLGLGRPDHAGLVVGGSHRATLLAHDSIGAGALHEYRIPIPPSMTRNRELRRVTLTLAWTSTVRSSQAYRELALDLVDADGKRKFWKGVQSLPQPHPDAMRRGNTFHVVMEGKNLIKAVDANGIFVGVQARATHDTGNTAPAPYALLVTLELGAESRSDVYNEVRTAVAARAAARPRARD